MPGCGGSVHDPSYYGGYADRLHQGLSYGCLQLLRLLGGEELVDVDDESLVELVHQFVVSGEHFDVRVVHQRGVDLRHVLLNDCSSGHGVVDRLEVCVDGLGRDLFTKPSLDGLVRRVETDKDRPPYVVPRLLDRRVVYAVEVVGLDEDVRVRELVGHPRPLSEGDSYVLVHHGESAVFSDLFSRRLELHFALRLFPAAVLVVAGRCVGRLLFEFLLDGLHEHFLFCCH